MKILKPVFWCSEAILHARALAALIAVWLTTGGHTMNFREMNASQGWISAQGYGLHSALLLSIVFGYILAKKLRSLFSALNITRVGLLALVVGSCINGMLLHSSYEIYIVGRIIAGLGSGAVLLTAMTLIPPIYQKVGGWTGIVIPAFSPGIIGATSFYYGWSNWEGGFLFEGTLALLSLLLFIPDLDENIQDSETHFTLKSLVDLPFLAVFLGSVWYLMHWGQLEGWIESNKVFSAILLGIFSLGLFLFFASTGQIVLAFQNGWPRLILVFYAGLIQYFNVSDMGVYGGLLINFNVLQRPWIVWSLSFGYAFALATGMFLHTFRTLPLFGLLALALGMHLAHEQTMGWNYWNPLNQIEFNWFSAPQHWQLAIPRFLMGFGVGWILLGLQHETNPSESLEKQSRQQLVLFQFLGGALSMGLLVNYLLIGHQLQYSFTSDRGFIQEPIVEEYRSILENELRTKGFESPLHGSQSLMFKSINYEADNLLFAHFYRMFTLSALALAVLFVLIRAAKAVVKIFKPYSINSP